MNVRKTFLIALLALLTACPLAPATTVGLSSGSVNGIYAEQKQSEWCWAACIQMITNLYGADLTQEEVVARTYGPGVNRAGTLAAITANLNGSGTTHNGRNYTITSRMLTTGLLPAALVAELTAGRPVLLGCDAGGSGHAVVCTAVTYQGPEDHPTITTLTVRDPWPSASNRAGAGRQVLRGDDLGLRVLEGWIIHVTVRESDGSAVPVPQGYVFNDGDLAPQQVPAALPVPSFQTPRPSQPLVAANDPRRRARREEEDEHSRLASGPVAAAVAEAIDLMQSFLATR